jgi:Holliday junction DNA helicase RuvA
MIGKLKGQIVERFGNQGLIETSGGVYYQVFLPSYFYSLPLPAPVEVYTYLQVREDALTLYGFENRKQLELFNMLHSISGVGPKTAFTIVSFIEVDKMESALKQNDLTYFTKIPGLGKKTAMKIVLELGEKLKTDISFSKIHLDENDENVLSALTGLGFPAQDVRQVLPNIDKELPLEKRITSGIQLLTKRK